MQERPAPRTPAIGQCETDHAVAFKGAQDLSAGFRGDDKQRQRHQIDVGAAPNGAFDLDASGEFREAMAMADMISLGAMAGAAGAERASVVGLRFAWSYHAGMVAGDGELCEPISAL